MRHETLKHESFVEVQKAIPAVAGATIAGLTLNEVVALLTAFYVLVQTLYLLWKWNNQIKKSRTK